ncbi:mechanosensitive ion channel family protein [Chitinophaga pinensis]|uniref:MscS Mechanosensitive ion channel n=1 Tax=Chitinophaga pinensis (strain ATCC 43595 / DSM 2588 / LMG 13176 / NBRC 15968 / NCIMB 11800 / UQM 2034) TaxID=485918 RepID=A0A979G274_CHIPD|nr:mechanosensitive ion channel domain-containing protein [Chitinophaga pinensis]ACU59547.1 MscS Mechanosensitive ion channel [Chitinophaga pinensis DSM 2588]
MFRLPHLVLILSLLPVFSHAQVLDNDSSRQSNSLKKQEDSAHSNFVSKMQQFAAATHQQTINERNADKAGIVQNEIFENLKKTMQHAKTYLKNGIDTVGISGDISKISEWHAIAGDGIFVNMGSAQTYRNLTTSYNLLGVLQKRISHHKTELDNYHHKLSNFRFQIDSLASDSMMFAFPGDSAALTKYLGKLATIAREISPADSILQKAMIDVEALQTKVNMESYRLTTSIDELELYQRQLHRRTWSREFTYLWQPTTYDRSFTTILGYSLAKSWLTFRFYAQNNYGKILFMLFLIFMTTLYIRSLKTIYRQRDLIRNDYEGQLVLRYPVLTAILIIVNVFQFIFPAPPFAFNALLWSVSAVSLTLLFRRFIIGYWMKIWIALFSLFIAASVNNLILQASRIERWFMFMLAASGILVTWIVFNKRKNWRQLREQWIIYFIGFLLLLELASIIANCYGRYNLSKTLLTSGYFNVVIAIMFLWTVRLINEGLELAFNIYSTQDRKLFYLNFQRIGNRAPKLFYLFLIVGWFILFGRNFYAFHLVTGPVQTLLSEERSVGDYTFTINTLLLFVLIMGLSVVISRIVSYFAADRHLNNEHPGKTEGTGIGSWLLLIRIFIITLGLLLSFAAAGIPMDKLAIILGALGVGIGFGLQTLVHNLVSGLIIAFEKPVNVGDIVEIDKQSGVMKSIGFRSSVLSTWDGANMVMPNGDLLNSHLINWTLGGNRRRMQLTVNVALNSDLEKVQVLLQKVLDSDDRISKQKKPLVLFDEFVNSSINVKVIYWLNDYRNDITTKSDLIIAIQKAFQQNDITFH